MGCAVRAGNGRKQQKKRDLDMVLGWETAVVFVSSVRGVV